MSKVVSSLMSGKYSHASPVPDADETRGQDREKPSDKGDGDGEGEGGDDASEVVVAPRMFKHLVGQGHSEFSTGRQQDAAEYMQHLLEVRLVGGAPALVALIGGRESW